MPLKKLFLLFILSIALFKAVAQTMQQQQGLLFKYGTSLRLGSIKILNKHNLAVARSGTLGTFSIAAAVGDTLAFSGDNYQDRYFVVSDFLDAVIYMQPATQLAEVVVKANSISNELNETQRVYRSKGVFYTGAPHYYYLFCKPMTFIYENLKSEVKNARKFKKYAKRELANYEVAKRFNDSAIKSIIPIITADELANFKDNYTPSIEQMNKFSDYDLIIYIKKSYKGFKTRQ